MLSRIKTDILRADMELLDDKHASLFIITARLA